jgi:LysM repeat protein
MTTRLSSSSLLCALAFALVASPLPSRAQTAAAPADAAATNTAPAPAAPAPAAPAATPAPADTSAAPAAAPAERPTTYTLAKGDTLASVAKKFDTSIHALVKLNNIPKSMYKKLQIGKVLQIPPAATDSTAK